MKMTEAQVKRLLVSREEPRLSQFGLGVLVTRLRAVYHGNPKEETLLQCAGELNEYLQKFEAILEKDFAVLEEASGDKKQGAY